MTPSAISDYERGKVDPQTATFRKLMGALSLPLSVLDDTQAFIDAVTSQVGNTGAMVAMVEESVQEERELIAEINLLAADGGRFAARFLRVLFVPRAGSASRDLGELQRAGARRRGRFAAPDSPLSRLPLG